MAQAINRRLLEITAVVGFGAVITFSVLALTMDRHLQTISGIAYGASLFCCSLCSLLYNVFQHRSLRQVFRLLDHSAIFVLIAGTYTPLVISGIAGPFGISLLTWIWSLALLGIISKLLLRHRLEKAFILLYLALGWLFIWALPELMVKTPAIALILLAAGGVVYSIGAIAYWCGTGRWADSIWHGFVLGGILLHFGAVLALVLAPPIGLPPGG